MKQTFLLACVLLFACGPAGRDGNNNNGDDDDGATCPRCSDDKMSVIDCNGNATACPPDQGCSNAQCMPACEAAEKNHASIGCDYYGVDMDAAMGPPMDACYTMFVANTSQGQAHMNISFNGSFIDLSRFAKIPQGQGMSLQYGAYDPGQGLAPGQVAIVFLGYAPGGGGPLMPNVACPVPAAIGTEAQISGNGIGHAFHLETDMPVVAYQMLPYGGGAAAATGASLLLPTSAWSNNYVAVTAYDTEGSPPPISVPQGPSMNIVAMEDDTTITMRPKSAIGGGGGIPAATANGTWEMKLNKGEHAQITQFAALSGSPIQSDKPVGVFGGHQIMSIDRCCGDHGEQMIAPVRALGYEYVAAPHPERKPVSEVHIYRIFGAVDGTALTYDPPNVGPDKVELGQFLEIRSADPFTVRSQDQDHPFLMFTYMSGAGEQGEGGWGDADFVRVVPPAQYMKHYVFFADPTYPFTGLTVVRKKKDGAFKDVKLACSGALTGWHPVGSGDFEITTVKLVDHWAGQGGCNNGVNEMDSEAGFGVWVWGWGSEDTNTGWVSYGYPAGEGVLPINDVVIL
ncbi:MAG TPA: IgGFc-binding protein [Kofleriaceae bacterium]|nr:IgGFc-binding protein [Kofleriaceae bacterium]